MFVNTVVLKVVYEQQTHHEHQDLTRTSEPGSVSWVFSICSRFNVSFSVPLKPPPVFKEPSASFTMIVVVGAAFRVLLGHVVQ